MQPLLWHALCGHEAFLKQTTQPEIRFISELFVVQEGGNNKFWEELTTLASLSRLNTSTCVAAAGGIIKLN